MPSIQIKDVPDETHAVLRRRAAEAHQSLQEYLLKKLVEDASRPTLDEMLDRIERRSTDGPEPSMSSVVNALREDRARH